MSSPTHPVESVIQVTARSSHAFAVAAEGFGDAPLATTLLAIASRRLAFASALLAVFRFEPPDPEAAPYRAGSWQGPSVLDEAHRRLLAGLLRTEEAVLFRYSLALAHDLPEPLVRILSEQFAEVGETHDNIQAVKDA